MFFSFTLMFETINGYYLEFMGIDNSGLPHKWSKCLFTDVITRDHKKGR